ncbi:transglutaminase-like domain-containing protein [Streptomyces sp. PU-14G]|uniref:transglutaminase-like domain-containing protein n=1 Tax=Streptomyces sp. PU-14G TaxID=2800808 RepID=UPI0034DE90F6
MHREFYVQHSRVTDPGELGALLTSLPDNLPDMSKVVCGAVVHRSETSKRFGFEVPAERFGESEIRFFRDIVQFLGGMHGRPADQRLAGTCRDFCIVLCALLRQAGIPARLRGGYADYFPPYPWDDHWVVEYWESGSGWRFADPQMAEAAEHHTLDFDVHNVPRDRFVPAGEAWLACRRGHLDPARYTASVIEQAGMGVVQGTVVRDLAALNRFEVFPWDSWGIMTKDFAELTAAELTLLDRAAAVGAEGGPVELAVEIYREHPQLRVPDRISGARLPAGA